MQKWKILAVLTLAAGCSKQQEAPQATPPDAPVVAPAAMNVDLLKSAPTDVLANEVLNYEPIAGHHFEVKAPQRCGEFKPSELTARGVTCQVTAPGSHKIALNICDDAKTYCKPVRYELTATAPAGYVADGSHPKVLQPPKHEHRAVDGFLVNQPDEAVASAKKDGKLLFIHFYGIWCPPCNMLEEYVYPEKAFLDATAGMVRVMIDADSDLSWDWKAHFKIGGYPTVVIATADLQEIDRLVGSKPTAAVVKWAQQADAHRATPIETLLAAHQEPAGADAAARKRIGEYYAARREWDDAAKWLDGHADPAAAKLSIEVRQHIAKREGDDVAALALTQQLVKQFPSDISFSSWTEELLEKKAPGAEDLVQPAFANLERWKTSPDLGDTGYGPADVWWMQADLHLATGDKVAASAAYLKAAQINEELAKSSNLTVARGANMERAYALHKAGENEAAKALYTELATTYAAEFSFNYNFAHVLNELEERDQAYEYVKKAEAHAYGDNWLRAVTLRAKIEHAMGNADAAQATIDGALAQAVVPRSTDVRTHGYLKRLRSLRDKVTQPTN